jgi:acetyl-CoA synthetase
MLRSGSAAAQRPQHCWTPDLLPATSTRAPVDPDGSGAEVSARNWVSGPTVIKNTSVRAGQRVHQVVEDGSLNVAANCIDRHVVRHGNRTASFGSPTTPRSPRAHIS